MEIAKLNATLKEDISTKSGKPYQYIEIQITGSYSKKVFLEQSEMELLKLAYKKQA